MPGVLLLYAAAPKRLKNAALLLSSLLFYIYGEPVYVLLILAQALSGYLHGLWLDKAKTGCFRRLALISACVLALGSLALFKYADLFIGSVNAIAGVHWQLLHLALPIGISFYTFQTLSYVIDIYRGTAKVQRNPVSFFTYILLFPQLIAGPIVRYSDIAQQLNDRSVDWAGFSMGARRFAIGLGKKILLANMLGEMVATLDPSSSVLSAWLIAIGYTLQIYFDFSGYSDMAIGLGCFFGFSFPENFRYPYIADSITDFWRRWHMTLSTWFRDYVYIPLGGNRVSKPRWMLNILIVWGLTGLWHGANWTFALWGVYFALLLMLEKLFLLRVLNKAPRWIGHVWALLAVVLGFTLFRSDSLTEFFNAARSMFGGAALWDAWALYQVRSNLFLLLFSVVGCTPLPERLFRKIPEGWKNLSECLLIPICILICTAFLVDGSFNPFLYFRF